MVHTDRQVKPYQWRSQVNLTIAIDKRHSHSFPVYPELHCLQFKYYDLITFTTLPFMADVKQDMCQVSLK